MNNIRKARIAADYTQKQVAQNIKVSEPTVSDWENGKKLPSTKNLAKLSELLNVPSDYLLEIDIKIDATEVAPMLSDIDKRAAETFSLLADEDKLKTIGYMDSLSGK